MKLDTRKTRKEFKQQIKSALSDLEKATGCKFILGYLSQGNGVWDEDRKSMLQSRRLKLTIGYPKDDV